MEKKDIYDALISLASALNGMLELAHDEGLALSPTAEVLRKRDGQVLIHIQFVNPEDSEEDYAGQ